MTFSAILPRDAEFDVLHYHIHNGWSIWNGRLDIDLAPAEMHSFLNPTYNALVYGLIQALPGPVVAAILAIPQALILPALFYLTRNVTRAIGASYPGWWILVVALVGFYCEPQMKLFASIRNDSLGALGFITALALIIPEDGRSPDTKALIGASLVAGLMMGLKLTNAVYVLGFAAAVMIAVPGLIPRIRAGVICAVSGLSGILLGGGVWAWTLYEKFGNPVFPMMNGLFGSPDGPDYSFTDTRRVPEGILEGLVRPFIFLFDGSIIDEGDYDFFDPRFQIAYLAALLIAAFALWRSRKPGGHAPLRPALILVGAVLMAFFAWTYLFSIQRYILVMWLLGPTLALVAAHYFVPKLPTLHRGHYAILLPAVLLFAVTTQPPMRRVAWTSFTEPYVKVSLPEELDLEKSIVLFSGDWPAAFTSVGFPQSATLSHAVVQEWSAAALVNYRPRIEMLIEAEADRPVYAVIYDAPKFGVSVATRLKSELDLRLDLADCVRFETNFDRPNDGWSICRLGRSLQ